MTDRSGLHLGQSVRIGGGDDVGIIIEVDEQRGFQIQSEQGQTWHGAEELTPAPVPARSFHVAVEALQMLAARHWGQQQHVDSADELIDDPELRSQLQQHNYAEIETTPLGYNQIWVESDRPRGEDEEE